MKKLVWLVNRLRAMDAAEVAFRVKRTLQARAERAGWGLARVPAARPAEGSAWCRLPAGEDPTPYAAAADRVLAGRFDVFSLPDADLGFPPDWHRDPRTGTVAPMAFGKAIDYRDEAVVGDTKYLWEPNRHLELVWLAQAWAFTRQPRYADGLQRYLTSWFDRSPYPLGPNWTSSLESGIRLVNWAAAWQLIGGLSSPLFAGTAGQALRERWCTSVYQHLHFIAGHLSLHSSANNHLLGECLGWLVGALMWPMWPESTAWARQAATRFEAEALKQNHADGVNRERAIYYQHAVIDMMFVGGLAAEANGIVFSSAFWERLERMLEMLAAVTDAGGHVPMLGDADDAVITGLNTGRHDDVYRAVLALGAVHFSRRDFAQVAGRLDAKTRWLKGAGARETFAALVAGDDASRQAAHAPARRAFDDGGYWVLGSHWGTSREVRLVADAGGLGYLATAAHGHAAALAFTLSIGGAPLLIDAGTYAYHTMKKWRDYFRGTSAHNTVRIDGADQSVAGGNFLWVRHAQARCLHFDGDSPLQRWKASHDGYTRLPDAVVHTREMAYDAAHASLEVEDAISAGAGHAVEMFWHLAPDCVVALADDGSVHVTRGSLRLSIVVSGLDFERELIRGSDDPPLGWISTRFDDKQPAPCLRYRAHTGGNARWQTRFTWTIEGDGAARPWPAAGA